MIGNYTYDLSDKIGSGFSSCVYKGRNNLTGQVVAIKVIDLTQINTPISKTLLKNEINVLRQINHPNLIKVYDIYITANNTYIISEFCDQGDLADLIHKKKRLDELEAFKLLKQVLSGMKFLQSQQILHRDIKPANILISKGIPKLADFGFAVNQTAQLDQSILKNFNVGTPLYMAPETILYNQYSEKSDIWALGVVLYEIVHGYPPYKAPSDSSLLNLYLTTPVSFSTSVHLSKNIKALIQNMLMLDQNGRYGINQVLEVIDPQPQDTQQQFFRSTNYQLRGTAERSQTPNNLRPTPQNQTKTMQIDQQRTYFRSITPQNRQFRKVPETATTQPIALTRRNTPSQQRQNGQKPLTSTSPTIQLPEKNLNAQTHRTAQSPYKALIDKYTKPDEIQQRNIYQDGPQTSYRNNRYLEAKFNLPIDHSPNQKQKLITYDPKLLKSYQDLSNLDIAKSIHSYNSILLQDNKSELNITSNFGTVPSASRGDSLYSKQRYTKENNIAQFNYKTMFTTDSKQADAMNIAKDFVKNTEPLNRKGSEQELILKNTIKNLVTSEDLNTLIKSTQENKTPTVRTSLNTRFDNVDQILRGSDQNVETRTERLQSNKTDFSEKKVLQEQIQMFFEAHVKQANDPTERRMEENSQKFESPKENKLNLQNKVKNSLFQLCRFIQHISDKLENYIAQQASSSPPSQTKSLQFLVSKCTFLFWKCIAIKSFILRNSAVSDKASQYIQQFQKRYMTLSNSSYLSNLLDNDRRFEVLFDQQIEDDCSGFYAILTHYIQELVKQQLKILQRWIGTDQKLDQEVQEVSMLVQKLVILYQVLQDHLKNFTNVEKFADNNLEKLENANIIESTFILDQTQILSVYKEAKQHLKIN